MMAETRSKRFLLSWLGLAWLAAGFKLWLVAAQPVIASGGAGHDDQLYLELANQLLLGNWLGDYTQFTLMKGPMYSLWVAACFLLGVPLPIAQHLLYLAACAALVRALRPYFRADWQRFFFFMLLAWQPMSYELPVLGRILRQNLYTPLSLLVFAGLCALETRRAAPARVRLGWSALLGFSLGGLLLTREESVWIAPGAALLSGLAAWRSWQDRTFGKSFAVPAALAIACAAIVIGAVATINFRYYGWFGTVEFRAPEFKAAYGALQRPVSSYDLPYVPVTREVRMKLYAASPTFAELQPWLEGDIGVGWAAASEPFTGRPRTEREIAGGWFVWALRDAVIAAGHGQSARTALDFYRRVGAEINAACARGELGAVRPRRDTFMPPWRDEHSDRLKRELDDYVSYFFLFRRFSAYPQNSAGPANVLTLFRDLTRWPIAHSDQAPELDLPQQYRHNHWRLTILQAIGKFFRWVCVVISLSALPGFILLWFWRQRLPGTSHYLCVALGALASVISVVSIHFLVHVVSFPNLSPGSFAQAYPLLVAFGALVWMGLVNASSARMSSS